MKLNGIARKVFLDRYSLKSKKGKPIEKTPEEMWKRVAKGVSEIEDPGNKTKIEHEFYDALKNFKYVPGGRILTGVGTGYDVTFYNCFVIPSPKDSRGGIIDTLKQMIEIMAHGGGVGINLSSLRPRGARVEKVNGFSSGPCNWAELFSLATKDIIQQGGSRRGALMLMLWDWHPDIEEFITVKQDLSRINGANLSVCVSDGFMQAVKNNDDWELIFPDVKDPDYDELWSGDIIEWKKRGKKVEVRNRVRARDLWDRITQAAWASAEPGVVFMERYNKWHNNWYWNRINCVNPCVTADTRVQTTHGIKSIGSLYNSKKPFSIVVNGRAYLSSPVKKTGVKQVFRLKTKEGYEVRLTKDHEVYTPTGKKPAGKLVSGEKLFLSIGGYFGNVGTYREGLVLGWLVGDGSVKKDVATLYFYHKEKQELAPMFAKYVQIMINNEGKTTRHYSIAPQYVENENKAVIESVRLWRIAQRYGLRYKDKYHVPPDVFRGSRDMQKGFLQGLFSSDGTVLGNPKKGVSVRLTSVSKSLLVDVQQLLLNFGIASVIYTQRRPAQERILPDGKGGAKFYKCQAYHELCITKDNLKKFANFIGFLQQEKQTKLRHLIDSYICGPYKETYEVTFDRLIREGVEDVFDITVDQIHKFSANGLIVSNCGEEGLPPWGVCNLGSINLSAFVKQKKGFASPGVFDYELLKKTVRTAVRFQDNVIDSDKYIFSGIREVQLNGERRIGLGTMGLGDALIKMHVRYGSDESLELIEKIYEIIRNEAYRVSIELAKERGPFPKFDKKLYPQGKFIRQLPEDIQKSIAIYGIRNSVILMQAPTGSTSLMAGVTSGIEPVYEFEFIRRDRLGEHVIRHPLYEAWLRDMKLTNGESKKATKPSFFVTANDLFPEDHVRVQAAIQKYVDASISKTVNAPNTHTVEDVQKIYMMAYDLGLKGIAYMRDGSRPGVLSRKDNKTEKTKHQELQYEIKPRPMLVNGSTYKIDTPVGTAFITINTDENNMPYELFINIGRAGSDVTAMAEGLGRIITLILRMNSGLDGKKKLEFIIDQLDGIGGAKSLGFGDSKIRSLPDAVSKVLMRHFAVHMAGRGFSNNHNESVSKVSQTEQQALMAQSSSEKRSNFDICPKCGDVAFAYEEGCKKCYSCGYSECG